MDEQTKWHRYQEDAEIKRIEVKIRKLNEVIETLRLMIETHREKKDAN